MIDSLITPEVRAIIGQETLPEPNKFPISEEMAYDLANATEDPNPLYSDGHYAGRSRFGGLLCPPLATWKDIAPPCLLYTSPSPRDLSTSRMPSSA